MVWLSQRTRVLRGSLNLFLVLLGLWLSRWNAPVEAGEPVPRVCIVTGAAGEPEFGKMFQQWTKDWSRATAELGFLVIGQEAEEEPTAAAPAMEDRARLKQWIAEVENLEQATTCWLILQGHGTFDGKLAKFNLRGSDVSSKELAEWLSGSKHRWIIAVCASSSAPFLPALSHPGRIVITATKSGSESNLSRFGGFFAQSFSDPSSDLDHDQSISVLEAFVWASRKTELYYQDNKLLASEHALLEDNQDGKGTGVEFFRGIRPVKRSETGSIDGEWARRSWLKEPLGTQAMDLDTKTKIAKTEREIEKLKEAKSGMQQDEYYRELEVLLRQLARLLYSDSK